MPRTSRVLALVTLVACGGGGDGGPTPPTTAAVATVSVSPGSPSIAPSQTVQLTATLRDAGGNQLGGRSVAWSASPSGVGTVSSSGLVTAIAEGTLSVTASSEGKSGTATVTVVSNAVATVVVSASQSILVPQQTTQLTAVLRDAQGHDVTGRSVSWSSSQPQVGTVTGNGVVTALTPGDLTITATADGKSGSVQLTVTTGGVVGASGGTLDLAGGAVELIVPPGAVSTNTTITVTSQLPTTAGAPPDWQFIGPVYVLGPAGTTFAQPVTVKLSFQTDDLPAWVMSGDLSVLQFDGAQWAGLTDIAVDVDNHTISGRTTRIRQQQHNEHPPAVGGQRRRGRRRVERRDDRRDRCAGSRGEPDAGLRQRERPAAQRDVHRGPGTARHDSATAGQHRRRCCIAGRPPDATARSAADPAASGARSPKCSTRRPDRSSTS